MEIIRSWFLFWLLGLTFGFCLASTAQAADGPEGLVVMQVSDAVDIKNRDTFIPRFDHAVPLRPGPYGSVTEALRAEKPARYAGVRFNKRMTEAGADGRRTSAIALNDWKIAALAVDIDAYGVILAMAKDGIEQSVLDCLRFRIICRRSEIASVQNELYKARSIRHLRALEARSS